MTIFTFRTEMESDNNRIPLLMKSLGVTEWNSNQITDQTMPDYKMGVFTFCSTCQLGVIQSDMKVSIDEDERLIDLHRCYETLAEGDKPNELWYLS